MEMVKIALTLVRAGLAKTTLESDDIWYSLRGADQKSRAVLITSLLSLALPNSSAKIELIKMYKDDPTPLKRYDPQ
jgi:hypothetical protein